MELKNDLYRVVVRSYGFDVYAIEPPSVQITTIEDGQIKTEKRAYRDVLGVDPPSVFSCDWSPKEQDWLCDIDCGAQRFRGIREEHEVQQALEQCEFSEATINHLLETTKNG